MSNSLPQQLSSLILTVDTSSARGGMAITEGSELIALLALARERNSGSLLLELDWLLTRVNRTIDQIAAFGVVIGPGSFTGLRVGLATIKGLAYPLARPIMAMNSLAVIASSVKVADVVCALIDAHRGEAFAQLYKVDGTNLPEAISEIMLAPLAEILTAVADFQQAQNLARVHFCGELANLRSAEIEVSAHAANQQWQTAKSLTVNQTGWILQPSANFLVQHAAIYAAQQFQLGQAGQASAFSNAADITALYVRPAEAEVKLKLGLIGKKRDAAG